jgi:hypothetical protein
MIDVLVASPEPVSVVEVLVSPPVPVSVVEVLVSPPVPVVEVLVVFPVPVPVVEVLVVLPEPVPVPVVEVLVVFPEPVLGVVAAPPQAASAKVSASASPLRNIRRCIEFSLSYCSSLKIWRLLSPSAYPRKCCAM